jgi:lysophospholipase L1-like esterase
MSFAFYACSGATTGDLWPSGIKAKTGQLLQLQNTSALANASIVTVSIGGDDLNFHDILVNCSLGVHNFHVCDGNSNDGWIKDLHQNILDLRQRLVNTYKQILLAAPNATLYVVGYPDLLPPKPSTAQQNLTCPRATHILPEGVGYLAYNERALDNVVQSAVAAVPGVHYVDLNGPGANSFIGHSVCASTSWFNGVRWDGLSLHHLLDFSYSFHPNAVGQANIAELVEEAIAASPPTFTASVGPKSSILLYGDNDDPSADPQSDPSGMDNISSALEQSGFNVTSMPGSTALPSDLSSYGQIWYYGIDPISTADEQTLEQFVDSGGSVFFSGEWGDTTDWDNQSVEDLLSVLVPSVSVSGDDDETTPLSANTSVIDNLAISPNPLTTWTPNREGALSNVSPNNVLFADSSGNASAAAWQVGNNGGRLVIFMDINWAQSPSEDFTTMPEVTQNVGYFLSQ